MSRVIWAQVILRDACDPDVPGDCAPVVKIEGATELEGLVSEFGIAFEEPIQEQADPFEYQVDDDNSLENLIEDDESWEDLPKDVAVPEPEGDPECPLEPDRPWDESVCGELERRVVSRILNGG